MDHPTSFPGPADRDAYIARCKQHLPAALEKMADGGDLDDLTIDEIAAITYFKVINNDL